MDAITISILGIIVVCTIGVIAYSKRKKVIKDSRGNGLGGGDAKPQNTDLR